MSNTPLETCPKIIKWFFVIFNVIFALLGLALVGVGGWLLGTNNALSFLFGSNIIGGAALIVICGGVTFIIAIVGVIGAIFQLRPILLIFAIALVVIIILEVVGAILGFVFRGEVETQFTASLDRAIQTYLTDAALRNAIDLTQTTFDCCGINNASDWENSPIFQTQNRYPDSCCSDPATTGTGCPPGAPSLRLRGCVQAASALLSDQIGYAIALGVVALLIGLFEIVGIFFSVGLCICIHRSKLTEV